MPVKIGICGHRKLPADTGPLHQALFGVFAAWRRLRPFHWVFLSALAEGADRAVLDAYAAWARQPPPLEAYLPFPAPEYEKDFTSPESITQFRNWLSCARALHLPPQPALRPEAYFQTGRLLADDSDRMLFLWDGQPPRGPGGTAHILQYAREIHKPRAILLLPRLEVLFEDFPPA